MFIESGRRLTQRLQIKSRLSAPDYASEMYVGTPSASTSHRCGEFLLPPLKRTQVGGCSGPDVPAFSRGVGGPSYQPPAFLLSERRTSFCRNWGRSPQSPADDPTLSGRLATETGPSVRLRGMSIPMLLSTVLRLSLVPATGGSSNLSGTEGVSVNRFRTHRL